MSLNEYFVSLGVDKKFTAEKKGESEIYSGIFIKIRERLGMKHGCKRISIQDDSGRKGRFMFGA